MTPKLKLEPGRAAVVVVDVQERLAPAMEPGAYAGVLKYGRALIEGAKVLGMPVLATEQYPKGLGPTVRELAEILPAPPLAKMTFSCGADPDFRSELESTERRQIILCGMETHVCVFQTARDLAAAGYEVHVCADAVASRTAEHRRVGLDLAREAGAYVTTAETALFDLLHRAGTPEFKAISALVK